MKRIVFRSFLFICFGVGGASIWMWSTMPIYSITQWNAARIKTGMTENEVVDILGIPHGDYSSDLEIRKQPFLSQQCDRHGFFGFREVQSWRGDCGTIQVYFDGDG